MNCKRFHDLILLSETGEISQADARALAEHLAACPACREYGVDAQRTVLAARQALRTGNPRPSTMDAIRARSAKGSGRVFEFPQSALRTLAYAAVLFLAVGVGVCFIILPGLRGDSGSARLRHDRIVAMSAIIGIPAEEAVRNEAAQKGKAAEEAALKAFARQLLIMEGMWDEEPMDDAFSPAGGHSPTGLRSRSSGAPRTTECV